MCGRDEQAACRHRTTVPTKEDPHGSRDRTVSRRNYDPAVHDRVPRRRPQGPAFAHRGHAVAKKGARRRSVTGRAVGDAAGARALLDDRVRLAQVRGTTERAAAVHDRDRRGGHPLHPRALQARGRHAADHDPRLARLDHRAARDDRPADRPDRSRRRPHGRVPPGFAVDTRLRVLGRADRARLARRPHRTRVGGPDGSPRLHALRRPGGRRGRLRHGRDGPPSARGPARRPPQRAHRGGRSQGPTAGAVRAGTRGARRPHHVLDGWLRHRPGAVHPAADDRLLPAGFTRRAGGLDAGPRHRQLLQDLPRVRRRRAHGQPHPRQHRRQHHAVLADGHRRLGRPVVLGVRTGPGRGRCGRPGSAAGRGSGRLHELPRRGLPCPAQLGRGGVPRPRVLQRARQGRPLRCVGGAGALLDRGAGCVPPPAVATEEVMSTAMDPATEIRTFRIDIPDEQIDDLRRRIAATRWPSKELVGDRSQGVQLATMKALARYWTTEYDWRKCEARLNALPQFTTEIDGVDIHFIHVRSPHEDALPLVMTHGWPGSVIELLDTVGPLTDPTAHGGDAEDAFHLVLPSIPGYGFSGEPAEVGWDAARIGQAWAELMRRIGYTRYVAQGGDRGAVVTDAMARQAPEGLLGVHINVLTAVVVPGVADQLPVESEQERAAHDALSTFTADGSGYFLEMATRPQTIGYALLDSPVALAAWMLDHDTDGYYKIAGAFVDGRPTGNLTKEHIVDNVTLYWLTGTGASAARDYWEDGRARARFAAEPPPPASVPVGFTTFPDEVWAAPRSWVEVAYPDLAYFNAVDKGGHFAAWEEPELFSTEVRAAFSSLR